MIKHRRLYKRNVDGSIQVWSMEQEGARYRTRSGKQNGAMVVSEWTTAQPKNVGRSNETSSEEQATAEVESAYTLKQKGGYRDTPHEAEALATVKPMLAHEWDKHKKKALEVMERSGLIAQPKFDGIRCLASKHGLVSRKGNPIVAVPHIMEALKPFFKNHPNKILDGELYTHALKEDFPTLVSLVKKQKPSKEDLKKSEAMEYHAYDYIDLAAPETPMNERSNFLWSALYTHTTGDYVEAVGDTLVHTLDDLQAVHEAHLKAGYEGTMLRWPTAPYQQKRTNVLLKYKDWVDHEYKVISIHEGEGNRSGMAGYAVCAIKDDTFRANIMGTRSYLKEILENKKQYEGGVATVIHTPTLTPKGKPRFPRIKVFHGKKRSL